MPTRPPVPFPATAAAGDISPALPLDPEARDAIGFIAERIRRAAR